MPQPHIAQQVINVDVTVVDGAIQVSPESVAVQGQHQVLQFNLLTTGCSFPSPGDKAIVLDPRHKAQFPKNPHWRDAQTVTLYDCNTNTEPCCYKYTVNVLDSQGRLLTLDPQIENEGKGTVVAL